MENRPILERASWVAGIISALIALVTLVTWLYQLPSSPETKASNKPEPTATPLPSHAPPSVPPLDKSIDKEKKDSQYRANTFWEKIATGKFDSIRNDLQLPIYKEAPTFQTYIYFLAMAEGRIPDAIEAMSPKNQRENYPSYSPKKIVPKWPSIFWSQAGLIVKTNDGTHHLFKKSNFPPRDKPWNGDDWRHARKMIVSLQGPARYMIDVRLNFQIENLETEDIDHLIQALYIQGENNRATELLNLLMTIDVEGNHSEVELTAVELALLSGDKVRARDLYSGTGKTPDFKIDGRYDPAKTCLYEAFTAPQSKQQLTVSKCKEIIASNSKHVSPDFDDVFFRPLLELYVQRIGDKVERELLSQLLLDYKYKNGSGHLFNWIEKYK